MRAGDCAFRHLAGTSIPWLSVSRRSGPDREQPPLSWDAFEVVLASVIELEGGSGYGHRNSGRNPHLTRQCPIKDMRRDVDPDHVGIAASGMPAAPPGPLGAQP